MRSIRPGNGLTSLLLALSCLVQPLPVVAGKSAGDLFDRLDNDGDGRLSQQEWRKKRIFRQVDLDGDGFITLEELRQRLGEGVAGQEGEMPDPVTMSAIRRASFDDPADLKARGLIETGLHPVWPADVSCRGIDEWYAMDYTHKRPKESYHGGIDIPAPFGTPILAAMAGEVVALYEGQRNPRGIEVVLRHTPEQSGLPLYLYSRYTHFERMPGLKVGQRVPMGEVLGTTGNSGVRGCELTGKSCRGKSRRPALHFDILYTRDSRYFDSGSILIPFEAHWMDPNALYRKGPPYDSRSLRGLPDAEKAVAIAYRMESGEPVPSSTRMIWPYPCVKKGSREAERKGAWSGFNNPD
ncbi:MAG: hypothetical protein B0D96_01525 [Candidatus Sedimenticola endophacoides]|nr:MAG: hypothetical protein B0D94_10935 [Candidatus Sedimenticola endophacoides]OQX37706.1 MAG: hypothetical protein B0D96_01525 [Candidatus Sedimenticola endophacoides]